MFSLRTPAVLLAAVLSPSSIFAQVSFNQIAITGAPAPGVDDGAEFSGFGFPSLNAVGDVAFSATLRTGTGGVVVNTNRLAIFGPMSGAGSPLGLIVRSDAPAPGVDDGAVFETFSSPALNASGGVAFRGTLRAGTGDVVDNTNSQAIFGPTSGAGSSLGLIAREDTPAPGIDDGLVFGGFGSPSLNASGDVAFRGLLSSETGLLLPPFFNRNFAIFGPTSGAGSALGVIARPGAPAPGAGDGVDFFDFRPPSLNASGDVAFRANLSDETGDTVGPSNNRAIFGPTSGAGSSLGVIVRTGDPAPGVGDGAVFGFLSSANALNASGDVAFSALLTGAEDLVGDSNDNAIFGPTSGAGSPLGVVAREGDLAPGVNDGAHFNFFSSTLSLNASGDVAFRGFLRTGSGEVVGDSNDVGLFTSVAGETELVVRTGDLFPISLPSGLGSETRTISEINFSSTGLNDAGTLAFGLDFTDGTSGIFTATLADLAALTGDYNGDGFVGQADLDLVLLNFGDTSAPDGLVFDNLPGGGPFDGTVSQNELDGVLLNFGSGSTPATTAVPEPGVGLLVLAGLPLALRRRRAKS